MSRGVDGKTDGDRHRPVAPCFHCKRGQRNDGAAPGVHVRLGYRDFYGLELTSFGSCRARRNPPADS
jgi:hypothetical protein